MTVTVAVKSKDTLWVGADSRVNSKSAETGEWYVPTMPAQKILPLSECVPKASESSALGACTVSGKDNLSPLYRMGWRGFLQEISPDSVNLMAFLAAGESFERVPENSAHYMLAGFDAGNHPFIARSQTGTRELVERSRRGWRSTFAQPNFGLEINGIDDVIGWVFRARPLELSKLYRSIRDYTFTPGEARFVEAFCSEIKDLKKKRTSWDELSSNRVVSLVRKFLKLTAILNCSSDLSAVMQGDEQLDPLVYSGPPFRIASVDTKGGFRWRDAYSLRSAIKGN